MVVSIKLQDNVIHLNVFLSLESDSVYSASVVLMVVTSTNCKMLFTCTAVGGLLNQSMLTQPAIYLMIQRSKYNMDCFQKYVIKGFF